MGLFRKRGDEPVVAIPRIPTNAPVDLSHLDALTEPGVTIADCDARVLPLLEAATDDAWAALTADDAAVAELAVRHGHRHAGELGATPDVEVEIARAQGRIARDWVQLFPIFFWHGEWPSVDEWMASAGAEVRAAIETARIEDVCRLAVVLGQWWRMGTYDGILDGTVQRIDARLLAWRSERVTTATID